MTSLTIRPVSIAIFQGFILFACKAQRELFDTINKNVHRLLVEHEEAMKRLELKPDLLKGDYYRRYLTHFNSSVRCL